MKRFRFKKDGQLKDTNTFVFTFNTPNLPSTIKIAFLRVGVEVYIPNPLRCFSCQQYGHHADRCKNHHVCSNCGEPAIHHETFVKVLQNVPTVGKATMPTPTNVKFGIKKKKFSEYNLHWLVGCFGFNGLLRQYFSLYRAVSQREEKERKDR